MAIIILVILFCYYCIFFICFFYCSPFSFFFFFNDTAPTEIYTLSLHDALPISVDSRAGHTSAINAMPNMLIPVNPVFDSPRDRKSTRLNSSHSSISYAVFCLKKKKKKKNEIKNKKKKKNNI